MTPFHERPTEQRRAILHAYEGVVASRYFWAGGKTLREQARWQRFYLIGLRLEAHIHGDPDEWERALFAYSNRHHSLAFIGGQEETNS